MQNSYVGDIGDFGKYALLNALAGDELRLGVNWYLNADRENGGDGKFTSYPHLRACDPVLHDALKAIVQNDRSVAAVERSGILPRKTVFFSLPVSKPRAAWNDRALNILFGADLVFMDPDTGFGPAEPAYVVPEEVSPYLHRGQSLIIYQHHFHHEKVDVTIPRTFAKLRSLGCQTEPWAFLFQRKSVRIYFIAPAPAHVETLLARSLSFLNTAWVRDKHFELRLQQR
jgi:hypothetical protein